MITHDCGDARYRVTVRHGVIEEGYAGAWGHGLDKWNEADGRSAAAAHVLGRIVFAGSARPGPVSARTAADAAAPVLSLCSEPLMGQGADAVQVHTLSGTEVRPVILDGRVVGGVYADDDAEYCWLAGILPRDRRLPNARQAEDSFRQIEECLRLGGMEFRHVVRTWFYLASLLDWYEEFNTVRTTFFREHAVFDGLVPASTGIGAGNTAGAALTAGLLAMKPKTPAVRIEAVPSPLQCPALNYRSSFSRAVEIAFPDRRQLLISGTASIAPDGTTQYADDMDKQIERTMEVVAAILQSRGMDWTDVNRGIVYVRDTAAVARFDRFCQARMLPRLPLVCVGNVIVCRADLLFEMEVDAVKPAEPGTGSSSS